MPETPKWWTNGVHQNYNCQSNYPTQKCIGIIPVETGDYEKGTVVTCYSDRDSGNRHHRNFFTLLPDAIDFVSLCDWQPEAEIDYSKHVSTSFVVANLGTEEEPDVRIFAVTDVTSRISTTYKESIIFGEYQFNTGEWTETILYTTPDDGGHLYSPDIDINVSLNKLIISFTYAPATGWYVGTSGADIDQYGSISWTSIFQKRIGIPSDIDYPKSSVLFDDDLYVFLLVTGDTAEGTDYRSSLHRGLYSSNIAAGSEAEYVDLEDCQMCKSGSGEVGFLTYSEEDRYIKFRYYGASGMSSIEDVSDIAVLPAATANPFAYGLTNRGGVWHAFYYQSEGGVLDVVHKIRNEGSGESWQTPEQPIAELGYEGSYPSTVDHGYMCCQNKPTPSGLRSAYYGLISVDQDTGQAYRLFYRQSCSIEELEEGEPREPYVIQDAKNLVLSIRTLGVSKRDGNVATDRGNDLQVANWFTLSDGTLIWHEGNKFKIFSRDSYADMNWKTPRFNSGRRGRQRLTSAVITTDKDFQSDLQCTIGNENISSEPRVITVGADDSGTVRRANFMGREFEATLSHNDSDSDVEVRSLEFEIQQDQDLI